ncbi:GNAT family N-acetyltransferase [Nocardia yamanashiensis]|uniref:GNAT family N-acetyltransferase n=1 Tax=Nocardia yamanashiensis TaxID=209247 RepID=UPI001E4A224F|nr:GNAT family N-acetyltransferase [Nocardia yamanashiensis]UGT40579.1 GNAT family N-acetyltransferase [Nocardia yamanashiensis]
MPPSPGPVLRSARLTDLSDIRSLEHAEFGDQAYPYFVLRQLYDVGGEHWFVAEIDSTTVGYAILAMGSDGDAWMLALTIATGYRRRGIGRTLVRAGIQHCQDRKIKRLLMTVAPGNVPAGRLYASLGFDRIAHEPAYFGPREPRDVLARDLIG